MVLVEKKSLEAVTQAQINVKAQPVPQVTIPQPQPTKIIVVDKDTRLAKAVLAELENKAQDALSMTPDDFTKMKKLKLQKNGWKKL